MSNRVTCEEIGGILRCRIRTWKYWLFIIIWLPGSLFWVASAFDMIKKIPRGGSHIFQYIGPAIWILMGCFFTVGWVWTAFEKEIISLDSDKLEIKFDFLFGLGRRNNFDIQSIRNLSIKGPFGAPNMWRMMFRGKSAKEDGAKFSSRGTVTFEYGKKTYCFGPQLSEEDANKLVEKLKQHLPIGSL